MTPPHEGGGGIPPPLGNGSTRLTGLIADGNGKGREAHIAVPAEDTPDVAVDINTVLRDELDGITDELEVADADLDYDEASRLDRAATLSAALANAHEMRERLGRPKLAAATKVSGRTSGRTKGSGSTAASTASRKATSRCKVCGHSGHWAVDAECLEGTPSPRSRSLCVRARHPHGLKLRLLLCRDVVAKRGAVVDCRQNRFAIGCKCDMMRPSKSGLSASTLGTPPMLGLWPHPARHVAVTIAVPQPAVVYALALLREPALLPMDLAGCGPCLEGKQGRHLRRTLCVPVADPPTPFLTLRARRRWGLPRFGEVLVCPRGPALPDEPRPPLRRCGIAEAASQKVANGPAGFELQEQVHPVLVAASEPSFVIMWSADGKLDSHTEKAAKMSCVPTTTRPTAGCCERRGLRSARPISIFGGPPRGGHRRGRCAHLGARFRPCPRLDPASRTVGCDTPCRGCARHPFACTTAHRLRELHTFSPRGSAMARMHGVSCAGRPRPLL